MLKFEYADGIIQVVGSHRPFVDVKYISEIELIIVFVISVLALRTFLLDCRVIVAT